MYKIKLLIISFLLSILTIATSNFILSSLFKENINLMIVNIKNHSNSKWVNSIHLRKSSNKTLKKQIFFSDLSYFIVNNGFTYSVSNTNKILFKSRNEMPKLTVPKINLDNNWSVKNKKNEVTLNLSYLTNLIYNLKKFTSTDQIDRVDIDVLFNISLFLKNKCICFLLKEDNLNKNLKKLKTISKNTICNEKFTQLYDLRYSDRLIIYQK